MKNRIATFCIATLSVWLPTKLAFSHEGHGSEGPHWHASDAWMILALAVGVGVALWLSKGKK